METGTRRIERRPSEDHKLLKRKQEVESSGSPRRSCSEILHLGLTTVLWLVGLAVLVVGALLLTDARMQGLRSLQNFRPLQHSAMLVVIIGSIIVVVGTIGCIAVAVRNRILLATFSIFVSCVMLLEVAACILAWYYQKGHYLESRLAALIGRVLQSYGDGRATYDSDNDDWNFNRNALSFIEYTLHCCGSRGSHDYIAALIPISPSCFHRDRYNVVHRHEIGCVDALQDFLFDHGLVLGLLCVAALLLQLVLIVLSMMITSRIRTHGEPRDRLSPPIKGSGSQPVYSQQPVLPLHQHQRSSPPLPSLHQRPRAPEYVSSDQPYESHTSSV